MRGLGLIFSGLLGAGVTLAGSSDYLSKVGPAPLRFETTASSSARVVLPPLRTVDASSPLSPPQLKDSSADQTIEPAAARRPLETGESSLATANLSTPASTNSAAPPSGFSSETNNGVSPQMLLRF